MHLRPPAGGTRHLRLFLGVSSRQMEHPCKHIPFALPLPFPVAFGREPDGLGAPSAAEWFGFDFPSAGRGLVPPSEWSSAKGDRASCHSAFKRGQRGQSA